jgi:hypothetical protein
MRSLEPSYREQWNQLEERWQAPPAQDSPVMEQLSSAGLRSLIPLGRMAGFGMQRAAQPAVFCDLVAFDNRQCMLVVIGTPGGASRLDSVALKTVARAQRIALRAALPIAFFWLGSCRLAEDPTEIFPDFDAAGTLCSMAAEIEALRIPSFIHCQDRAELGGWMAGAMGRQAAQPVDFRTDCEEFLAWMGRLQATPASTSGEAAADPRDLMPVTPQEYDMRGVLGSLVDGGSLLEYRGEYGRTLICAYAQIGGIPLGIVANQRRHVRDAGRPFEFGGVIYASSADKGARFVLGCNQNRLPLLFVHDVNGFMVGRDAEVSGIIRSGAKMVNAVANSVVPKISLVIGGSYGAGNYAMCGKAFDPLLIIAWPTARYSVMGGDQASRTLSQLQIRHAEESGARLSPEDKAAMLAEVKRKYDEQMDPRYAAARLWVDHIVFPQETRQFLLHAFSLASRAPVGNVLRTGVIQT